MKWILRGIGLILFVVLVAVVSLMFLPADRIARIAADQLRSFTGRDVTITGDVSMTFWPVLGVSAGGLEVGNASWTDKGPMLTAANAAIGVDAMSLLRGDIRITNIEATSPTIRLELRRDGRASWQFTDASGAAQIETATTPARPARPIGIERLKVTDARLIYDAEGSDLVAYEGVDLTLDWPERLGTAEITATLRPAGEAVTVTATIDRFASFITGAVQPVVAELATGGDTLGFDGRASTSGAVAGALRLATTDTGVFLRNIGLSGADLPQGLGRSIDMRTDLTLTPDRRLALRDLVADLGGNRVTGAADITLRGVPQVNAQLNAGALDLTGATGGNTGGAGGGNGNVAPAGSGWPTDRIDAGGLAAFNGEIALRADSIDLGGLRVGATRALVRNDRSRMVIELREVAAYAGQVTGEFVMNNRSGLSVGGTLNARGIEMQPLLTDAAGLERFNGRGDADLSFLGSGASVDAILKSLSGKGAIKVGRGTITGIDLDRLMRAGDAGGGTTVFDSLGASFDIAGGVLQNDDLLLLLPNYRATGTGVIDIGAQTLDYLVTPTALRANAGRGVAIPVRIVGPWSAPRIKPDLQAVIDLNFAAEKQAVEARAKDKLRETLQQELGVSQQDGQTVEDAVRDKVEDKLRKKLFKLLE
ncbi:AsmA family protein [Sulfitobacter sabulilitoris]|uniref:AsmA family protein n=1 Tax=Sulfitobacter sabulilitoris TaxID=2562655 RepID=A0A5S3PCQ8_9RHOB|nr:AsmA family protein [Sulfitobacter sabulilitoris]TMM51641.1 AsmA family protein [Sulfitobacter sabulilitoris]